jgi:hypothetical protein
MPRWLVFALLVASLVSCGTDEGSQMIPTDGGGSGGAGPGSVDVGAGDEGGGSGVEAGPGGGADTGGLDTERDGTEDGAPVTGCATGAVEPGGKPVFRGDTCPPGTVCCAAVPYPQEGVCLPKCTLRSDRALKEDVSRVDPDRVLERLALVPVSEWRYREEGADVRHIGPMAQDFHEAFGLGDSERDIHPVDANGVLMAAIQALYRRIEDLGEAQHALGRENDALRRGLDAIRSGAMMCDSDR